MTQSHRKWPAFFSLLPGLALYFLDQTILPVALPVLQKELGASEVALEWTVNAYLLMIAVFVLLGGKVSDRIGHRRAYLWGISLFSLASLLCGMSLNSGMMIGARALQGLGASLIFPAQTALLSLIIPTQERGRMMGLNVSIGSIFLMLGPLIGGYLTEFASWRWIFWINIPIALIGFFLIRAYLPNPEPRPQKIDRWGFLFFAVGLGSLITALMQVQIWGWLSQKTLGLFALSAVSIFFLFLREKRSSDPFLDLKLFKQPVYTAICVSVSIVQFIVMITVFWAIYFQTILAYSPSESGGLTFISTAPVLIFSALGGYLSDKISPKLPIAIGFVSLIFSFFWLGFFSTPSFPSLMTALILFGMGIPLVFTPSYSAALGAVPKPKIGVAFGMLATLRNFAATFGLALIGLLTNTIEQHQLKSHTPTEAQIASFSISHFVLGFILILAFALIFVIHNRKSAHHLPEAPAEGWD